MDGWIVIFSLPPKLKAVEHTKFGQQFWGSVTSSWGGKYRYRRKGLMDEVKHRKLIRGVLLIKLPDVDRVRGFLEEWEAEVFVRRVRLEPDDIEHFNR